jgi:hypothetical protein
VQILDCNLLRHGVTVSLSRVIVKCNGDTACIKSFACQAPEPARAILA